MEKDGERERERVMQTETETERERERERERARERERERSTSAKVFASQLLRNPCQIVNSSTTNICLRSELQTNSVVCSATAESQNRAREHINIIIHFIL